MKKQNDLTGRNVLFWVGIKSTEQYLIDKHGGFKYLDVSRKSWEWWCEKNDVIFFPYETPGVSKTVDHKPTWQRWFDVFDQIEAAGIDYNKIAVIDGSTLVKWDCPNFFDQAKGQVSAFRSIENFRWISQGADGYKDFFGGFEFDLKKYISCGFQVFGKEHKQFLLELKDFYFENYESIMSLQNDTVKRGTDQPVYNYMLQIKDVDVYTDMMPSLMLTHLTRFDWFSHNWQLQDKTPFFIKYGHIWFYSGFPNRGDRYNLMQQTWDMIKENYE
tara:strand:- start:3837 stop:4655 length:819 start_codon:yes stop_codon:yes gene_type:complete